MKTEERNLNREQLAKCFADLADRAKETDEPAITSLCLVITGSIIEGSDELLALWVSEYARARIDMIREGTKDEEEE